MSANVPLEVQRICTLVLPSKVKHFIGLDHGNNNMQRIINNHPNHLFPCRPLLNIFYRGCIIIIDKPNGHRKLRKLPQGKDIGIGPSLPRLAAPAIPLQQGILAVTRAIIRVLLGTKHHKAED